MQKLKIPTERGVLLDGVLFNDTQNADTVLIAITGIHGNFYSNPFYYNFGATLNKGNVDFIYAQTNDALLIGTYDTFTYGDPVGFLENINNHFVHPEKNKLIFIEKTGHTYQQKQQETAEKLLELIQSWCV